MKRFLFLLRKVIYPSCVIFTFSWLFILGIVEAATDIVNNNFYTGLLCYCIALAIAVSNLILDNKKLSPIGCYLVHMLICVTSISVIVSVFSLALKINYVFTGKSFYLVLILIVCYFLVATPLIFLHFRKTSSNVK